MVSAQLIVSCCSCSSYFRTFENCIVKCRIIAWTVWQIKQIDTDQRRSNEACTPGAFLDFDFYYQLCICTRRPLGTRLGLYEDYYSVLMVVIRCRGRFSPNTVLNCSDPTDIPVELPRRRWPPRIQKNQRCLLRWVLSGPLQFRLNCLK